jgi:hypothetical protein
VPRQDAQQAQAQAASDRDSGIRKVSSLTWRAGAAGLVCSALIGVALAQHVEAAGNEPARPPHNPPGQIVIPAQPPQPATGSGQVSSGAS